VQAAQLTQRALIQYSAALQQLVAAAVDLVVAEPAQAPAAQVDLVVAGLVVH
jgi:hypothetical protein